MLTHSIRSDTWTTRLPSKKSTSFCIIGLTTRFKDFYADEKQKRNKWITRIEWIEQKLVTKKIFSSLNKHRCFAKILHRCCTHKFGKKFFESCTNYMRFKLFFSIPSFFFKQLYFIYRDDFSSWFFFFKKNQFSSRGHWRTKWKNNFNLEKKWFRFICIQFLKLKYYFSFEHWMEGVFV